MALPVNIEDLLNKRKVEGNRIEFKKGWNPISTYHTICAFANDIDNIGGGYILIGVDEVDGIAQRPVEGVPLDKLDYIQKELQRYNQLFEPYYAAKIFVEEVDGKNIIVLWVPSGSHRPYSIPVDVTAKVKKPVIYVRYGSTSIEAKGEVLEELRMMAVREPFDERGNPDIKLEDISMVLLRDYLVKVGSKLSTELWSRPLPEILDQMNLYAGPVEQRWLKNVSAMMFCENPSKFFKRTQVEVVFFPEGRLANPNNLYEAPVITGSVTQIIERTLEYLNRMVVMQSIIKPKNDNHSIKFYTYPYQALEESITNSLYHRDYREWEPVVITVEPKSITIQNVGGPDRSIPAADISRGELLISKRYRNRRLGEYLKELELTEGRSTGIPTIQNVLKANGSPRAIVVTDEERTFFRITIPCHEAAGNIIADIASKDNHDPKDGPKDGLKELTDRQKVIVEMIIANPFLSAKTISEKISEKMSEKMSEKEGVNERTIERDIAKLKKLGVLTREGGRKEGKWVINNKYQ